MKFRPFSKVKIIYGVAIVCAFSIWNYFFSIAVEKNPPQSYDECMGVHFQPEKEYVYSREGFSKIKTDRFGFNNDNIEDPVDKNIDNIIFLGDSYTEAIYIKRKDNYVKQTEKLLNDAGYKFRSINLGASGNAVPDYIYNASCFIQTFSPKYTVIQLHFNDLIDESLRPEHGNKVVKDNNTFAISHTPQTQKRTAHYVAEITGWFQPALFRLLENAFISPRTKTTKGKAEKPQNLLEEKEKKEIQDIVDWQMQELKRKYGENLIILYFPPTPQIIDGKIVTEEIPAISEKRDLIFEGAEKNNVTIFNTEDMLVKYYQETRRMPRGFQNTQFGLGHLNADGNYIVADFLYKYFSNKFNR